MPPRRRTTASRTRRQSQQQRQDIEDVIHRIFTQHFGRQGAQFVRLFRREFDGLATLPTNAVELVVRLWAGVISANPTATRAEIAAALLETLSRGGRDLRNELARVAGVDTRNSRVMGRFLRAIGPSIFRVEQTAALRYYNLGAADGHAAAALVAASLPGAGERQRLCRARSAPLLPAAARARYTDCQTASGRRPLRASTATAVGSEKPVRPWFLFYDSAIS